MRTIIVNGQEHFIAYRKAARAAYFLGMRAEKKASFGTYNQPVTFADLAVQLIFNENQN